MLIERLKTKNSVALLMGELIKLIVFIILAVYFEKSTVLHVVTCSSMAVSLIMIYEIVFANDALFGLKNSAQNMWLVFCTEFFFSVAVFFTPLFFTLELGDMALWAQIVMFMIILMAASFMAAGIVALVFKSFRDLQDYQEMNETKEKPKKAVKKKKPETEPEVKVYEEIKTVEPEEKTEAK